MAVLREFESRLRYARDLAAAVRDGIVSARHESDGRIFAPASKTAVVPHAAIGAGISLLGSSLTGGRRSASRLAIGGLIGIVAGLGAAAAWHSRHFTARAAKSVGLACERHADVGGVRFNPQRRGGGRELVLGKQYAGQQHRHHGGDTQGSRPPRPAGSTYEKRREAKSEAERQRNRRLEPLTRAVGPLE